ncbi:MAG: tocopherol cyclase family protein [Candidatus Thorarchaeota archaeon]
MAKKFYPEAFQGKLSKRVYYEGWYNKIVNKKADKIIAFIPTIALNQKHKSSHAFIQIFDGITGLTKYIKYNLNDFQNLSNTDFKLKIANNFFSSRGFSVDINQEYFRINGKIQYIKPVLWPKTRLQPGIMGVLTYLPLLETYHGIISMNHYLKGFLEINGEKINFNEGKGYLEKDWGTSFPKAYIWAQTNHFSDDLLSFVFSLALVPILNYQILGFFCVIWHQGIFYKFTTYTGAKIRSFTFNNDYIKIIIEGKKFLLFITIYMKESKFSNLAAPNSGVMSSQIVETINSTIKIKLVDKYSKKVILKDYGKHAGLDLNNLEKLH